MAGRAGSVACFGARASDDPVTRRSTPRWQGGQASVELLGAIPALLLLGLVIFQVLAVGYAAVLAGSAAEAGALALAAGSDPEAGVREALPGWSRLRARVSVTGGTVRVRVRPLSPLAVVARKLEITADASVEGL